MNDNEHPITPPSEVVQQLWGQCPAESENLLNKFATLMARWGWDKRGAAIEKELQEARDQELDACEEWIAIRLNCTDQEYLVPYLRAARRPKPPSLKEQSREALERISNSVVMATGGAELDVLKAIVEQLPD